MGRHVNPDRQHSVPGALWPAIGNLRPKGHIISCLCLLGLGGLLCSFAETGPHSLFRGISGVGTSGIMALTVMVVSDVTTLESRGKFIGILGSCIGLGNAVGPFISSAFTE